MFFTYIFFDMVFCLKTKYKNYVMVAALLLTVISPIVMIAVRFDNIDLQINTLCLISFCLFIKFLLQEDSTKKNFIYYLKTLSIFSVCVFYINSLLFNQLRYVLVLFPILTVIIFSAVYVAFKIYLKYKKNIKFSESFNVLLNKFPTKILISLLLFSAVFFVNYKRYFNFNYLLYLILISIIACLLYFVWNNKKNFLCLILMVMYSFMVTYKAPIYFMEYFGKKSIYFVYKLNELGSKNM